MKKLVYILTATIVPLLSIAQQEAMFTHYMFNMMESNSAAYDMNRNVLSITGINRSQWVGYEGAPVTQSLTIYSPLFNQKLGVGLTLLNDKIGPTNKTNIYGDIAYRLKVSKKSTLSFGLKGGISLVQGSFNDLDINDNIDPTFQQNVSNEVIPNVGFGLFYSTPKYFIGMSSPRLLESDSRENTASDNNTKDVRHYFLVAGVNWQLNSTLLFKPTTFVRAVVNAPVEFDLSALFEFNENFWAGPMFRYGDSFGFLAGLYINQRLKAGYSYDYHFALKTGTYNGGSHEIVLKYDFVFKDKDKIRSPRYF